MNVHPIVRLMKLAIKAGPAVVAVVRYASPLIRQMIEKDPQRFQALLSRMGGIVGTKKRISFKNDAHAGIADLHERCAVLRDQVTYLYASADRPAEAQRAVQWRDELEAIERVLPIIESMSKRSAIVEYKRLERRIDQLASTILAASIVEEIEDAELVSEEEGEEIYEVGAQAAEDLRSDEEEQK